MLIQVIFSDDSPVQVEPEDLDELIRNRKIMSFRRSGRWVKVGLEPVRGDNGVRYNGPERRRSAEKGSGRLKRGRPLKGCLSRAKTIPMQEKVFCFRFIDTSVTVIRTIAAVSLRF